jgi:hypothetical protein
MERVHGTVRFIAVSEDTSHFWGMVGVGILGALPWFLVLRALFALLGVVR